MFSKITFVSSFLPILFYMAIFLICNIIFGSFDIGFISLRVLPAVRLILLRYLFSFEYMKHYYDSMSDPCKKKIFKELLLSHPCYSTFIFSSLPTLICQTSIGSQFTMF